MTYCCHVNVLKYYKKEAVHMQYYIQEIAGNYLKNLSGEAEDFKVAPVFLYGTDRQDFVSGYNALVRLFKSLYNDIISNPASFGMLLKEMEISNAKNSDYTGSGQSLVRVPNLLFVLGAEGELQPDMSLRLEGAKLTAAAKELKITGLPLLLKKLTDYGLVMEGLNKTVKENDVIAVSYPDNRYMLIALKALAEAMLILNKGDRKKPKAYFYMLHSGLLASEKVKNPKLGLTHMRRTLDIEKQKMAEALDETVSAFCKLTVRMGGFLRNDWSCVYTGSASKKVVLSLSTVQDRRSAKLNLQNINKYIDTIAEYPENIRETIKTCGWDCGHCHDSCAGPFSFEFEGKAYNKCRCGAFAFQDISKDELPYCKELLNKELEYHKT
jgi:hypothetical protein